ncbi:hypothetical protein KC354_g13465 [Hortaea werneckii]|nr:hypothetical protein KC354_g13465 [Hortaea werneckii]
MAAIRQDALGPLSDAADNTRLHDGDTLSLLETVLGHHRGLGDSMNRRIIDILRGDDHESDGTNPDTFPDHALQGRWIADGKGHVGPGHVLPESRPATGSHSQASLGNPPTGKVKTKWIDKHRRAGLRSGKLLPQDDQELEPANAREADVMRQHRMAGFVMAPQENKSIDESAQATQPEKPVSLDNEPILIPSDIHLSSPAGKQTSPLVVPEGHSDSGIAPPSCQGGAIQSQAGNSHAEEDWHASQQESPDPCLLEQMDLEMAQQLDYELNHVTPVPKPSVQDPVVADPEWDDFGKRRQRMEQLAEAHASPFAPVLAKLIRHFEEKCREQAIRDGTVARPLNYSPPIMYDSIPPKIDDILSLETPETCANPGDAWLTDTIVDFMVGSIRRRFDCLGRKHFVAEWTPLTIWISDLKLSTTRAEAHVRNPQPEQEAFDFPLANMPVDTKSISLIYNVNASHWVHILLQVDHEKKEGTIILHDSMGASRNREPRANGKMPPKGSTLAKVESQLPSFARLISMRPSLQWGDVQWSTVRTAPCPQQSNDSDCGVFAIIAAAKVADGLSVDAEIAKGLSSRAIAPLYRWAMLSVVHEAYFGQHLPDEAWQGYDNFVLSLADDVQAASEPAGVAEGHETPMPTESPIPAPDGDDASDSEADVDDDILDVGEGSRGATRKRLGLVRRKMEKSMRELGVYPSQVGGSSRQDEANESLMTDRMAICDLFRHERRSLTIDEISAGVSDRLHPMPIPALPRLTALLESTPHSFSQDSSDGTWSLRDGAGRSHSLCLAPSDIITRGGTKRSPESRRVLSRLCVNGSFE